MHRLLWNLPRAEGGGHRQLLATFLTHEAVGDGAVLEEEVVDDAVVGAVTTDPVGQHAVPPEIFAGE
jgi:hypothetical protein